MKKYKIKIKGITPYMQKRMDDSTLETWEKNRKLIIERDDIAKEDLVRALFHSYQDNMGFYIPSEHVRGSMINAGTYVKAKVGNIKKSMQNIVSAMFFVVPEKIRFKGKFEIDKRSGVNRNIKARVIVIRPRWENWTAEFELHIDNDTITEETIKQVISYAGNYCGIGSFTPLHKGSFGRYELESIKQIK